MFAGDRNALRGSAAITWIRLLILVCTLVANYASAEEYVLQLEVVNVQAGKGFLNIALHDSALSYQDADRIPFKHLRARGSRNHDASIRGRASWTIRVHDLSGRERQR